MQYSAFLMIGLALRIFLPGVGSSWTLMPNPYESANEGSGLPQAAANGLGVAVGTGVGAGAAGVVGTVLPPPQAALPAMMAKRSKRRMMPRS